MKDNESKTEFNNGTELVLEKKERFTKLKNRLQDAQNIIIGTLLIYIFFFGWIANCGTPDIQNNPQMYVPDKILFVYTNFFNFNPDYNFYPLALNLPKSFEFLLRQIPVGITSLLILLVIGIIQSYRENFVVYSIKNNIWTVPSIILISWMWTSINANELFFTTIGRYFSNIDGYINILVILVVYIIAGVIGGWLKTLAQKREALIKAKALEALQSQLDGDASANSAVL